MSRAKLFLLRHPAVSVPAGICYGQSDVGLADDVQALAKRLRPALPETLLIISSPLSRCRLLAEALGPSQYDPRLMEMNFGDWELRSYDSIERSLIDDWAAAPLAFRPPGGETAAEMAERAQAAAQEWIIRAQGMPLLIVSHGGPLRAIMGMLLQQPPAEWLGHRFDYATLYPVIPTAAWA